MVHKVPQRQGRVGTISRSLWLEMRKPDGFRGEPHVGGGGLGGLRREEKRSSVVEASNEGILRPVSILISKLDQARITGFVFNK